jgi:hypothetical protein
MNDAKYSVMENFMYTENESSFQRDNPNKFVYIIYI